MANVIDIGQTDYSKTVFIPDPASTDGSGKTGLVAADLTVSYTRVETDNDVAVTDVTSSLNDLAALTTAHTDWGLKEVSSTLAPGLYRIDFADAVFASGAWSAVVYVMITTSAASASPIEFDLKPAPGSAGGTFIAGTNAATAIVASGNDNALTLTGSGSGSGFQITAGATGDGMRVESSGSGSSGLIAIGQASGMNLYGANGYGLILAGDTGGLTSGPILANQFNDINLGATSIAAIQSGLALESTAQAILTDTAEIGVAGAGLTSLGDTRIANLDAAVSTRMATYTQPTGFLATSFHATGVASAGAMTSVLTILLKLEDLVADDGFGNYTFASNVGEVMLGTTGENSIAAAVQSFQMTESYRANGAAPTLAQAIHEILAHLGESGILGTTKTINKLDHTTPAATFTLDDATTPSSITRAT